MSKRSTLEWPPNETLVEILLFADRDALDSLQLTCRFWLKFIRDREAKELPLRSISRVDIGQFQTAKLYHDRWNGSCWKPLVEFVRDLNAGKELIPDTVDQIIPYLRLAYYDSVCIDLQWDSVGYPASHMKTYRAIFDNLVVPNTIWSSVNVLTICVDTWSAVNALTEFRAFEAFKSVRKVVLKEYLYIHSESAFEESFFICAAECGVRTIAFDCGRPRITGDPSIRLVPALSFGLAQPTTGGDRSISGADCKLRNKFGDDEDFLAQLIKKVAELDNTGNIDFNFKLGNVWTDIDSTGFEQYQKDDGRTWLVNDLENHVNVEVKQTENLIEIHVFSSV